MTFWHTEERSKYMGLIGKVLGTGVSIIGAGAEAIGKGIESAFLKQEEINLEYLAQYPYKHKFIVREVKNKSDDMKFADEIGVDKDFFAVYDEENNPIYVAVRIDQAKKTKYTVIDMGRRTIANIAVTGSVLNAKKKNCNIEFGSNTFEISTNYSFDKRKFNISYDGYRIDCNDFGTEVRVYSKRNKKIIQINKVASDLGVKWGEYVIGCNEPEDTIVTILLGISVGIMLMKSANLLEVN